MSLSCLRPRSAQRAHGCAKRGLTFQTGAGNFFMRLQKPSWNLVCEPTFPVIIQLQEITMKFALLGAALVATAAFATPASAFPRVVTNPGYCAQFYPNANCQDY